MSIFSWFQTEYSAIKSYFAPIIKSIEANSGTILIDVADTVVFFLEQTALSGPMKLSIALRAIENVFKSQGMPFIENLARGAVEAAVAALPANQQALAKSAATLLPIASKDAIVAHAAVIVQQGIAAVTPGPAANAGASAPAASAAQTPAV